MWVCATYVWALVEARRVTDPLKLDFQVAGYELLGTESDSLQEHQVLLTAEPSSRSVFVTFKHDIGERQERQCVAALTRGDEDGFLADMLQKWDLFKWQMGKLILNEVETSQVGVGLAWWRTSKKTPWGCSRVTEEWGALNEASSSPLHPLRSQGHGPLCIKSVTGEGSVLGYLALVWGVAGFCHAEGPLVPHCHPRHTWPTTTLPKHREISEQFLWVSATGRETLTLNSKPLPHGDQIAAKDFKRLSCVKSSVDEGFLLPTLVSRLHVCWNSSLITTNQLGERMKRVYSASERASMREFQEKECYGGGREESLGEQWRTHALNKRCLCSYLSLLAVWLWACSLTSLGFDSLSIKCGKD